jgi:hypothetical protein
MNVSYALRLVCLCLATFFLVNGIFALMAAMASRAAIRIAERMRPRAAARLLFALRVLSVVLGSVVLLGFCVPSYLWFEPQGIPERAGLACITLAGFGAAAWILSFTRAARAIFVSKQCNCMWRRAGRKARLPGEDSNAVIVERGVPLLALAGVLRPRLIISEGVLRALTPEELTVALDHENAHRGSRDNLKRLLLLLAPDPLPFIPSFSLLDRAWMKLSEWAADDEAVQGDSRRALTLAEALLRVARIGAEPRLTFLHTSLVAADHDLSARVDRLLSLEPARFESRPREGFLAGGAILLVVGSLAALLLWPASLSSVHRLLELVLR